MSAGSSGTTTSRARTTARPEPVGDEDEHVRLTCAVGQWVPEAAHAKIGGYTCGQGSEHLRTLVDADQLRIWVDVEHPTGRLPCADAELEHPLGVDTGGRLSDGVLQLVVRRHLFADRLEIGGRVEVELVTIGSVDHGCSLAGTQQQSGRHSRSTRSSRGSAARCFPRCGAGPSPPRPSWPVNVRAPRLWLSHRRVGSGSQVSKPRPPTLGITRRGWSLRRVGGNCPPSGSGRHPPVPGVP